MRIDRASGSSQKILIHKNVGKFVGLPMDALIPLAMRFIALKFSIQSIR
jgi:hypothetical protein